MRDGRGLLSCEETTVAMAGVRAGLGKTEGMFLCEPLCQGLHRLEWGWTECERLVGLKWALNPQSQLSLPVGSVQHCVQSHYPMLYIRMASDVRIRVRVTVRERKSKKKIERS